MLIGHLFLVVQKVARQLGVAEHGYRSALQTFRQNRPRYSKMLRKHGITLRDPALLPERPEVSPFRSGFARSLGASLSYLDGRLKAGGA